MQILTSALPTQTPVPRWLCALMWPAHSHVAATTGLKVLDKSVMVRHMCVFFCFVARGEFPETLCIEQGVVLSSRLAKWKVRWTSRVLWMAVVSHSSENSSRQEKRELPYREQHTQFAKYC